MRAAAFLAFALLTVVPPAVSAMDHAVYDIWVLDCRPAGPAR